MIDMPSLPCETRLSLASSSTSSGSAAGPGLKFILRVSIVPISFVHSVIAKNTKKRSASDWDEERSLAVPPNLTGRKGRSSWFRGNGRGRLTSTGDPHGAGSAA
ncbi:hypothetical protein J19TS2_11910 [Cohnella xylanilytica]|nr:hypothetical protein J19TS2_11910 [Cohnella xylanilytica]